MTQETRAEIYRLLDTKKYSYSIIAKMTKTNRNKVAGLAFRRRHGNNASIRIGARTPHSYEPTVDAR